MGRDIRLIFGIFAYAIALPGAFEIRMASGETDLARYRDYGYNTAVLGGFTELATYDGIAPHALRPGTAVRDNIERNRRDMRDLLNRAAALGIDACLYTDEVLLPSALLEYFGKSITRDNDPGQVDLEKEGFWEVYRAKYREVLADFPEVAYVMIRTGESGGLDGYTGQAIADQADAIARSDAYFRIMQRMIDETRRIVVDEFGRKLIWRTWDLGNYGFHANTAVYDRVLAGIQNRKGLILSIKFTQTDYWRYNGFNPNIGGGRMDQIVEFQCAREYEGKGAFPNYMGAEHAAAMRQAAALGVKGVWVWDFGGGRDGPFPQSDRWVRLNIEATARLAQDPSLSPRELAETWATREFGEAAAARIADILELSPACVLGFTYIAPYARNHRGWLPSRNIMRDDLIRGDAVLGDEGGLKLLYEGSRDALDEVLAEKEAAASCTSTLRRKFEDARDAVVDAKGEAVYNDALSSFLYMESLAAVMSHYVRGMFLYYSWQSSGDPGTGRSARDELLAWNQAWSGYRSLIPSLPGAATLYRSLKYYDPDSGEGAMEDTCRRALAALLAEVRHEDRLLTRGAQ